MRNGMMILILFILVVPLYGFNSLVRHEDIPKMRELGISQEVIQYFITNQTCSISSKDVIKMKQSGLNNKDIMSAIRSDLYRPEKKSTSMEEAELIAKLNNRVELLPSRNGFRMPDEKRHPLACICVDAQSTYDFSDQLSPLFRVIPPVPLPDVVE